MATQADSNLPKLAAPARRALADAGYVRLEQLSKVAVRHQDPELVAI